MKPLAYCLNALPAPVNKNDINETAFFQLYNQWLGYICPTKYKKNLFIILLKPLRVDSKLIHFRRPL